MRWVVLVARLLGLAPYRCDAGLGYAVAARAWRLLSVVLVLLCGGVSLAVMVNLYGFHHGFSPDSVLSTADLVTSYTVTLQLAVFCWSLVWRQYPGLVHVLNFLHRYPAACRSWGLDPCSSALGFTLCSYCVGFVPTLFRRHSLKMLAFSVWPVLKTMELALFGGLLALLAARFEALACELRRLLEARRRGAAKGGVTAGIRRISREHQRTADMVKLLAHCFAAPVLLDLLTETWWSTSTVLAILGGTDNRLPVLDVVNIFKSVVSRAYVVLRAHAAANQGNRILAVAHSFRNVDFLSRSEEIEVQDFAIDLCQRPVRVVLEDVLELNARLLFTTGVTAATWLVILLQF